MVRQFLYITLHCEALYLFHPHFDQSFLSRYRQNSPTHHAVDQRGRLTCSDPPESNGPTTSEPTLQLLRAVRPSTQLILPQHLDPRASPTHVEQHRKLVHAHDPDQRWHHSHVSLLPKHLRMEAESPYDRLHDSGDHVIAATNGRTARLGPRGPSPRSRPGPQPLQLRPWAAFSRACSPCRGSAAANAAGGAVREPQIALRGGGPPHGCREIVALGAWIVDQGRRGSLPRLKRSRLPRNSLWWRCKRPFEREMHYISDSRWHARSPGHTSTRSR